MTPASREWQCFGCGEHGDAAALVMQIEGSGHFPRPFAGLPTKPRIATPSGGRANPPEAPGRQARQDPWPPKKPSGLPLADALKLVEDAAGRLWTPEGDAALDYPHGAVD